MLWHDWRGPDGQGNFYCEVCGVARGHNEGEPCLRRREPLSVQCSHHQLASSCNVCKLEARIATLEREREALMQAGKAAMSRPPLSAPNEHLERHWLAIDIFNGYGAALRKWMAREAK